MNSRYDELGANQRNGLDGRDTEALRTDIERTRGRMSDTLDQIGERLNVNRLKGEVRDTVREQVQETKDKVRAATIGRAQNMARNAADGANEARHSLMHTIRENPVPAAMVGIGLGWLVMGSRRERNSIEHRQGHLRTDFAGGAIVGAGSENTYAAGGYYADQHTYHAVSTDAGYTDDQSRMDRAKEKAGDLGHSVKDRANEVKEGARHVAGDVRDKARVAASTVSERTHEMVDSVGERTQRLAYRTRSTIDDNPVAMGAVALAVGLAAGMTIPASRREAELMGPTRDRVVDRARSYADETREKVQRVASEVVDDVRVAARDAVDEVKESAKEAAREEGLMGDDSSAAKSGGMSASGSSSSTGNTDRTSATGAGSQLGRTSGIRPDMGGTDGSI